MQAGPSIPSSEPDVRRAVASKTRELATRRAPAPYPFLERFGPYYLVKQIGRGGMAEVYKAVTKGSHRFFHTLAVKRVLTCHAGSADYLRMFAEEARVSALLHHPNLVHVHDFGEIDGVYFIAMEYLRGWSLARVLGTLAKRGDVLPVTIAAYVAQEVASGLAYAHALTGAGGARLRIVHRDVHPGNVMLLRTGGVKLLDFGVAKATSANRLVETRGNVLKGTLSYLAPEQIEGGVVDERTDVFALGVSLWEMLTGRRLFAAPTEFQVLKAVLSRPIAAPSALRPEVPPELDAIVLRALARDPSGRYATADEIAEDLETYVRAQGLRRRELPEFLRSLALGSAPAVGTPLPSAEVRTPTNASSTRATRATPMPVPTERQRTAAPALATTVAAKPAVARGSFRATPFVAPAVAVAACLVALFAVTSRERNPNVTAMAHAPVSTASPPQIEALVAAPRFDSATLPALFMLAPVVLDADGSPTPRERAQVRRFVPAGRPRALRPAAAIDRPVVDGFTIDPFAAPRSARQFR